MASDPGLRPNSGHRFVGAYPTEPPQKSTSTAMLALSVFGFFIVLAAVAILIVALVR